MKAVQKQWETPNKRDEGAVVQEPPLKAMPRRFPRANFRWTELPNSRGSLMRSFVEFIARRIGNIRTALNPTCVVKKIVIEFFNSADDPSPSQRIRLVELPNELMRTIGRSRIT